MYIYAQIEDREGTYAVILSAKNIVLVLPTTKYNHAETIGMDSAK